MSVTQRLCDIDHFGAFTAIDKAREQGLCPPGDVLSRLKSPIVVAAASR
jgi:hypothetical protein